ncbi:hypothetical protein EMCRGX_G033930 [Ephydatia muelleri]
MRSVIVDTTKFTLNSQTLGLLVGLPKSADELVVVGHCTCLQSTEEAASPLYKGLGLFTPDWKRTILQSEAHFPAGTKPCGILLSLPSGTGEEEARSAVERISSDRSIQAVCQGVWYVAISMVGSTAFCFSSSSGHLEAAEITGCGVQGILSTHTRLLRLQSSLICHIEPSKPDISGLLEGVQSAGTSFLLQAQQIVLTDDLKKSLGDILPPGTESPVSVQLLECVSDDGPAVAPTLTIQPSSTRRIRLTLPLDLLVLVNPTSNITTVIKVLKEAICSQLRAEEQMLIWKSTPCSIVIRHRHVPTQDCPVTVLYPSAPMGGSTLTDSDLLDMRKALHHFLGVPQDCPYFRHTNREYFSKITGAHLVSPHAAVRYTRVSDGDMATVRGNYSYHHYMQDRINDDGWGCAYRSLQTLWSWFVYQGYTSRAPPTHRQVQQALVDVRDKEPSFVGSREWIGSFEVSTCLNQLLGIQCKIHYCSSGAEMGSVGRLLLHHFKTQWTPVMIGGGVLAHTILGVDYSEKTGEIRFLILDPHYKDAEDIKTVVDKGWCGWKPVTFWNQQAHYNLCLPQRPKEI